MSPILDLAGRLNILNVLAELEKGLEDKEWVEASAERSLCFDDGSDTILHGLGTLEVEAESEVLGSLDGELSIEVNLLVEQRTTDLDDGVHLGEKSQDTLDVLPVVGLDEVLDIVGQFGGVLDALEQRVLALGRSDQCNKN